MPQDEWVISRVFEKTGAGSSAAAGGGGKKRPCDGAPEVSSPSSLGGGSYEIGAASSHVPCFSMAAPPSYGRSSLAELPPPPFDLMHFPSSSSSSSSTSRYVKHGAASFGAFPTLKSLEDNLHLPLVFPAAPPVLGGGGGHVFGEGGFSQWPAVEDQKVCGSELDCMWS